jgi:hypothetical protein
VSLLEQEVHLVLHLGDEIRLGLDVKKDSRNLNLVDVGREELLT